LIKSIPIFYLYSIILSLSYGIIVLLQLWLR